MTVNRAKEILSGSFNYDCLESLLTITSDAGEEFSIDLSKISTEVLSQIIV